MKFITLTNHRSGSSHFQRLLNSHKDIVARQEDLRDESCRTKYFLDDLFFHSDIKPRPLSFGIKIMYTHLNSEVIDFIREQKKHIKVIQLIRNDLLETALWYKESFIGKADGGMGPRLVVHGKVKANIDVVIDKIEQIRSWINTYKKLADYTVYYEDFTTKDGSPEFQNEKLRKDLLSFLQVTDQPLYSEQNKKNKRGQSKDIVTNWRRLLLEIERQNINRFYDGEKEY